MTNNKSEIDAERLWDCLMDVDCYINIFSEESSRLSRRDRDMKSKEKRIKKNGLIRLRNEIIEDYIISFADKICLEHDNENNEFLSFHCFGSFVRVSKSQISLDEDKIDEFKFAHNISSERKDPSYDILNCLEIIYDETGINANEKLEKVNISYEDKVYVNLYEDISWSITERY